MELKLKQIGIEIDKPDPHAIKVGIAILLAELQRRRVKRSAAGHLPAGDTIKTAKVIKRDAYALRYVEAVHLDIQLGQRMIGRLDTMYGKELKWQN